MRHGSLFSGIGGFDLAAEWMGWENIFHCEWNPFGQQVLKYYWPKAISYHDITKTDFTIHRGTIDILTGGFPCQPHSLAGKQHGTKDKRYLWPHMLRCIQEVKPKWVVGENVYGLINQADGAIFENICTDLEAEGYEVFSYIIPAYSIGAYHQRDRIWIVAHASLQSNIQANTKIGTKRGKRKTWDNDSSGHWRKIPSFDRSIYTPRVLRNINGIPNGVDRNKSLGNAIVPQVALQIFKAINQYEKLMHGVL
jgi:DNA (cytosine-5)-methyltransferase 1